MTTALADGKNTMERRHTTGSFWQFYTNSSTQPSPPRNCDDHSMLLNVVWGSVRCNSKNSLKLKIMAGQIWNSSLLRPAGDMGKKIFDNDDISFKGFSLFSHGLAKPIIKDFFFNNCCCWSRANSSLSTLKLICEATLVD